MREEMIKSVLSDLNGSSADIEASAIILTDGLDIAALLSASMDEDRVGAVAAAMLSLLWESGQQQSWRVATWSRS